MLPSHYVTFVDGVGIGKRKVKMHIQEECEYSVYTSVLKEVASYENEELSTVDIMTNARHGWRKNAKDTSVVAIGEKTHEVLSCEHVTKSNDSVTERHKRFGTEKNLSTSTEPKCNRTYSCS